MTNLDHDKLRAPRDAASSARPRVWPPLPARALLPGAAPDALDVPQGVRRRGGQER